MKETGKGGVQNRCVKYARRHLWWARKFKAPGNNAVPDFVFAKRRVHKIAEGITGYRKNMFFVEFKATGKEPNALQDEEHKEMRAAGLTVYHIDDVEEFKKLLALMEP